MSKSFVAFIVATCVASAGAWAKLPPPSEEAAAKAAEAKAKADDTAKKDAELLTKVQDRIAAKHIKAQRAKGIVVRPTPIVATTPAPAQGKK